MKWTQQPQQDPAGCYYFLFRLLQVRLISHSVLVVPDSSLVLVETAIGKGHCR